MKSIGVSLLVLLLVLSCNDDNNAPRGLDASIADATGGNTAMPPGETGDSATGAVGDDASSTDASVTDASVTETSMGSGMDYLGPQFTMRLCSEDVGNQATLCPQYDAGNCQIMFNTQCPVSWGCGSFDDAKDAATSQCHAGGPAPVTATGCGHLIIEYQSATYARQRSFYDEQTGELVGAWALAENGTEYCSGSVPQSCVDYRPPITHKVSLCTQDVGDAGICMPGNYDAGVRVCSTNPGLVWDNAGQCLQRCALPWGCEDYAAARTKVLECHPGPGMGGSFAGNGCGFQVLWQLDPFGLPLFGFYDEVSGELMATWYTEDDSSLSCSGEPPVRCLDPDHLTGIETLCAGDGGLLDAGHD